MLRLLFLDVFFLPCQKFFWKIEREYPSNIYRGKQRINVERGGQVYSQVYSQRRSTGNRVCDSSGGFPRPGADDKVSAKWPSNALGRTLSSSDDATFLHPAKFRADISGQLYCNAFGFLEGMSLFLWT